MLMPFSCNIAAYRGPMPLTYCTLVARSSTLAMVNQRAPRQRARNAARVAARLCHAEQRGRRFLRRRGRRPLRGRMPLFYVGPPPQTIRRRAHRKHALLLRFHAALTPGSPAPTVPARLGMAARCVDLSGSLWPDRTCNPFSAKSPINKRR